MSSHAYIGIKEGTTIRAIYCHYDGYISEVGMKLKKYYKDLATVTKLIDLGSISTLGSTIGEKVDFDKYTSFINMYELEKSGKQLQTVAYHRDRGESLEILDFDSINSYIEFAKSEGDIYLYDKVWYHYDEDNNSFSRY